jgi:PAS domain S-box-containing protein
VEDEAIIATADRLALEAGGFAVVHARTGDDAVRAVESDPAIDLVLMDINLGPGIDGTEAARRILEFRDLPLIFHSSHAELEIVERTQAVTSYGYVLKDSGDAVLHASIRMAFRLYEERNKARASREALALSERRYDRALRGTGAGLWDWDMATGRCYYSPTWGSMLGYEEAEIEPSFDAWRRLWHPDDAEAIRAAIDGYLAGATPRYEIEHRLRHKDGSWRWILSRGELYRDARGEPARWIGTHIDLTELKLLEERAREKNAYMGSIIETTQDGFLLVDSEGRIVDANSGYLRISGYARGEILGMRVWDLDADEAPEDSMERIERIKRIGHETFRARHLRKDGAVIDVEMSVSHLTGTEVRFVCFARDVTRQKRVEDELAKSEERFRLAMEATSDGIWDWNAATGEVYYSPAYWRMLGYEPGEVESTSDAWESRLHPDDAERASEIVRGCEAGTLDSFTVEFRMRAKDGSWRWVLGRGSSVGKLPDGRASRMLGTHLDITDRKEADGRIEALLSEKDFLLRETHHRVKNFMATVVGALSLQAKSVGTPEARSSLEDAATRVRGMMTLYDRLYRRDEEPEANAKKVLEALARDVVDSANYGKEVSLRVELADVALEPKAISALGIVINELVTNSMKYAFGSVASPSIAITLVREGGAAKLTYADNGPGLPPEAPSAGGFGLRMISMMAGQLEGEFRIHRPTRVTLEFPLERE